MSVPWPMVVLLLAPVVGQNPRNRRVVQVLSALFLIGAAGEPSTWRWEARSNAERAVVVANLAIPALMWVKSRNVFGTLDR